MIRNALFYTKKKESQHTVESSSNIKLKFVVYFRGTNYKVNITLFLYNTVDETV